MILHCSSWVNDCDRLLGSLMKNDSSKEDNGVHENPSQNLETRRTEYSSRTGLALSLPSSGVNPLTKLLLPCGKDKAPQRC